MNSKNAAGHCAGWTYSHQQEGVMTWVARWESSRDFPAEFPHGAHSYISRTFYQGTGSRKMSAQPHLCSHIPPQILFSSFFHACVFCDHRELSIWSYQLSSHSTSSLCWNCLWQKLCYARSTFQFSFWSGKVWGRRPLIKTDKRKQKWIITIIRSLWFKSCKFLISSSDNAVREKPPVDLTSFNYRLIFHSFHNDKVIFVLNICI